MGVMKPAACIVCGARVVVRGDLCHKCCMSYDRARKKDNTTIALIRWAAARARRFVHAKARA